MSFKEAMCLVAVVTLALANDITPDIASVTAKNSSTVISNATAPIADSGLVPGNNVTTQAIDNSTTTMEPKTSKAAQIPDGPINGKNPVFRSFENPDVQTPSTKARFGRPRNNGSIAKTVDGKKYRESSSAVHYPETYLIFVAATTLTLMVHGNPLMRNVC